MTKRNSNLVRHPRRRADDIRRPEISQQEVDLTGVLDHLLADAVTIPPCGADCLMLVTSQSSVVGGSRRGDRAVLGALRVCVLIVAVRLSTTHTSSGTNGNCDASRSSTRIDFVGPPTWLLLVVERAPGGTGSGTCTRGPVISGPGPVAREQGQACAVPGREP
jgi:hypothetical protein